MPSSIINSDNGAVSGSTGIKTTGGDDGVLLIQTNGVTAATVDASQVINFTNPPTGLPVPTANVQTFDASGTWTKPATGAMAFIQVWGGGAGGSRNTGTENASSGAGGGYNERFMPLSALGSTVSVTVGAGGAGRTGTTGTGTAGGTSDFGGLVYATGGAVNGQGGSQTGAGGAPLTGNNTIANGVGQGTWDSAGVGRALTGFGNANAGGWWNGAGHVTFNGNGTPAERGGASGGGASSTTNTTGGISLYGGNGGNGGRSTSGIDGTAPGGGGGGRNNNLNGGNGGAGRVIVTVF
jgi:hypothetical protein